MSDHVEERSATTRALVDPETRRLSGQPIVFNSLSHVMYDDRIGRFREIIKPEAVDRTLRGNASVKALWNHNRDIVLGNTLAGTLRLRKNSGHLEMELYPPTWAANHMETVQRGDVDGMSFSFSVVDGGDSWDFETEDGIPLREVHDMHFSEVSIVAFPAYPATNVAVSQRSLEAYEAERKGATVEFLRMVHKTRIAR